MVLLYSNTQTPVLAAQEILCAPDPDGAVIRARYQVFPIAAEIQAGDVAIVTLRRWTTHFTYKQVFPLVVIDKGVCVSSKSKLSRRGRS